MDSGWEILLASPSKMTPPEASAASIISLRVLRDLRESRRESLEYETRILRMNKLELLAEMMRFQDERSRNGSLSLTMMVSGQTLFAKLEKMAETPDLRILTGSYRRHLRYEYEQYLRSAPWLHPEPQPR